MLHSPFLQPRNLCLPNYTHKFQLSSNHTHFNQLIFTHSWYLHLCLFHEQRLRYPTPPSWLYPEIHSQYVRCSSPPPSTVLCLLSFPTCSTSFYVITQALYFLPSYGLPSSYLPLFPLLVMINTWCCWNMLYSILYDTNTRPKKCYGTRIYLVEEGKI